VHAGLVAISLALAGCRLQGHREHIVMFDEDGLPRDPSVSLFGLAGGYERLENPEEASTDHWRQWDAYLERIVEGIESSPSDGGRRRIAIFIHGGLNTRGGAIRRANELCDRMADDGWYGIFVNWRSSLFGSYCDHLLFVRQGDDWGWWGAVFAPVYLVGDFAKAAIRAPFVFGAEVLRLNRSIGLFSNEYQENAARVSCEMLGCVERCDGGHHGEGAPAPGHGGPRILGSCGEDRRNPVQIAGSVAAWIATLPTKVASSPFVDSFGSSAWEVFLRRVHLLFHREDQLKRGDDVSHGHGATAFLRFFGRLALAEYEAEARGEDWEIVLIGHSMGAIVINGLLRHALRAELAGIAPGPELDETLPAMPEFARIVYLAAACSVRDYEESAIPYLLRHPASALHHVTLHDRADERERNYLDLAPRGSLLVWIDDFLARPSTPLDRSSGRFVNLMMSIHHIPAGLERRITVKECDAGWGAAPEMPQTHGGFDEEPTRFWRSEFYLPKPRAVEHEAHPAHQH
jgi:hypothetical protein